jgi:hypothetical protein
VSQRLNVVIGIDIGQRRDPTAICVAELEARPGPLHPETHYLIRHLDRLPLGTPYPEIARRLRDLCSRVRDQTGARPTVYVDATGVGLPVVDLLRPTLSQAQILPVLFTSGDRRRAKSAEIRLGKAYLVSRLQALLRAERIHLPQSPEAEALVRELLDYELRIGADASERYGAFRVGAHDDLVTALGLAVQDDGTVVPGNS